ncbi:1,4-dihydroxy-2-naphthoyl-CoA synthase [Variovorax boronicumulans]|nr:1,4-dihydroxy-2-naphthoyl-CoA synthase [Variovorax boronicumulans]
MVVLTGAGDRAFCTGGDQSSHGAGGYGSRGTIGLPMDELQSLIRDIPKPVIARVQGFAIGGGNVLVTVCDLAIASTGAVFGQVGPKVGSVDPGFGTALLARVAGEKRAREMWYLCRRYGAEEALAMGLVNRVVAPEQLDAEVELWPSARRTSAARAARPHEPSDESSPCSFLTSPSGRPTKPAWPARRSPRWHAALAPRTTTRSTACRSKIPPATGGTYWTT